MHFPSKYVTSNNLVTFSAYLCEKYSIVSKSPSSIKSRISKLAFVKSFYNVVVPVCKSSTNECNKLASSNTHNVCGNTFVLPAYGEKFKSPVL